MPTTTGDPDEVVAKVADVEEVPSQLVAEAKLRHEAAETDVATPQEKKQAAVEQAHALSTRPDGSYAQLHETQDPTLAVADEGRLEQLKKDQADAVDKLEGSAPAGTPAAAEQEQRSATARKATAEKSADKPAADKAAGAK